MKHTCIVIEDNEIERDLTTSYLEKINTLEIKAICKDASEAIKIL